MQNEIKRTDQKPEVIPTPLPTRVREFRMKVIPGLVFVLTLVAAWRLWLQVPMGSGLRGIGEGAVSIIASPQDGFLEDVKVEQRGWVQAGDALVTVVPFDPAARMDLLQSQLQLSRLTLEPSMADRNAVNYEQLRLDALRLKQELAMARANLERAEKILPRHEAMLKEQLITRDMYDLTVRDRDYYQRQVAEGEKALQEINTRLAELRKTSQPTRPGENPALKELLPQLEAQMEEAEKNWNPVTLMAPISGEVNFLRQKREFVRAGEQVLTINSPRADRIVAYLKAPILFDPQVGMNMEVVTRSRNPVRFETKISQIGARVEVITNAVAYVPVGAVVDTGLPLILPVPDDVQIRPGEVVDVVWKPARKETVVQ